MSKYVFKICLLRASIDLAKCLREERFFGGPGGKTTEVTNAERGAET